MIIDAWMQFPTREFLLDPMFDALRRWPSNWRSLLESKPDITPDEALETLKAQGVSKVIRFTNEAIEHGRAVNALIRLTRRTAKAVLC